jgi:hypothetical protein
MLISTEPCKLELETLVVNCDDCMNGTEGRPPLGVRGPVLRCRGRGVNGHAWRRFRVPLSSVGRTCGCAIISLSPATARLITCLSAHTAVPECPSQPAAFSTLNSG